MNFGCFETVCWRWPNWVFWISLLAVLTLADLEGSRIFLETLGFSVKKLEIS
jgi:hypothetical protein